MLATAPPSAGRQDADTSRTSTTASPPAKNLSHDSLQTIPSIAQSFPPSYSQTNEPVPAPALPAKALSTAQHDRNVMLPPLSTVTRGHGMGSDNHAFQQSASTPSWPAFSPAVFAPQIKTDSPSTMDLDTGSNSIYSAASPDRYGDGRAPSVNLDDPDVRLAAEALGDLRAGMCLLIAFCICELSH